MAGEPVERFGTSTTTNSSAEASGIEGSPGAGAPWAMPGVWAMMSVASPSSTLIISLSLPLRRMIALSGDPAARIVRRKPSPIDSTAMNTTTTPAMPKTVASEAPRRSGMVRTAVAVTAPTCENQLRDGSHRSTPPERVDDAQAHRPQRGQRDRSAMPSSSTNTTPQTTSLPG